MRIRSFCASTKFRGTCCWFKRSGCMPYNGFSPASSVCSAPRLAFVAQGAVTRLSLRALGVFHRARPAPSGALVGCSVLRSPSGGPLAHFVAQVSRRLSARHLGLFGSPCIPKSPPRATQLSSGRRNATFDARPGTFCCHHEGCFSRKSHGHQELLRVNKGPRDLLLP